VARRHLTAGQRAVAVAKTERSSENRSARALAQEDQRRRRVERTAPE